jgi:hypothetical protein
LKKNCHDIGTGSLFQQRLSQNIFQTLQMNNELIHMIVFKYHAEVYVRVAARLAKILKDIYRETSKEDSMRSFRISWADLRALAGGVRLDSEYINQVNYHLAKENYYLAPFDKYFALISSSDMRELRLLSGRDLEQFMPSGETVDDQIRAADDGDPADFED